MRILVTAVFVVVAFGLPVIAKAYTGPTRVNFDERIIKGQTAKSGSVYIFERQEIATDSLINKKRLFRERTIYSVFEE
ncbi:MAG: hypothetical protein JW841_00395 [Deltaproteobacteria bacterium]|nr:hypothetical protein [Deltaproteobacteria bacterium]